MHLAVRPEECDNHLRLVNRVKNYWQTAAYHSAQLHNLMVTEPNSNPHEPLDALTHRIRSTFEVETCELAYGEDLQPVISGIGLCTCKD